MNLKHLGLFEGIGGFSLAGRWAGWKTIAWCEWDKNCQRVLKHHFPNAIPHDDITKTDFTGYAGQIDVLTGGFPCQPYSSAGKQLGTADDRHLWPEMLRAIREVRPRWVVGENVRGLVSWNGGMVFDQVQADLEAEGYEVTPFILPACAVDAPHRRDRVWFVAYCADARFEGMRRERENTVFGLKSIANTKQVRGQQIHDKVESELSSGNGSTLSSCKRPTSNSGAQGFQVSTRGGQRCVFKQYESFSRRESCGAYSAPNWDFFPTQPPVCWGNDGIPRKLDAISFPKWREFSIGAYGNAIVPQVAFKIFKAINEYENAQHTQQPDPLRK